MPAGNWRKWSKPPEAHSLDRPRAGGGRRDHLFHCACILTHSGASPWLAHQSVRAASISARVMRLVLAELSGIASSGSPPGANSAGGGAAGGGAAATRGTGGG